MKNLTSLLIILLCIYIIGCKESSTQIKDPPDLIYPTRLNSEWEYQTTTSLSYYNQLGSIDSTIVQHPDNAIIKITKTNDSLKNYKGLIKFEIYNKLSPDKKCYDWYLNSDTSFIAIAYYNPTVTQVIQPKRNYTKKYLTLAEINGIIYSFSPDLRTSSKANFGDSILFYDIPRKVLAYPLSVGKTWVELYYPFYRERYINNYLNIVAESQQYSCYEVKVNWPNYRIEFNDYVSLDAGLVKREIISDSVMIANEYGDSLGFVKVHTISTLIRRNL